MPIFHPGKKQFKLEVEIQHSGLGSNLSELYLGIAEVFKHRRTFIFLQKPL
jgi:hypothetical protein